MLSFNENSGWNKFWKYFNRGGVSRVIVLVGALLLISVTDVVSEVAFPHPASGSFIRIITAS